MNKLFLVQKKKSARVVFAFIIVSVILGFNYVVINVVSLTYSPVIFAGIRYLSAGLFLFFISILKDRKLPQYKQVIHNAISGFFVLAGCNGLVMYVAKNANPALTSLILAFTPMIVFIFEILAKKNKLNWRELFCLLGGFVSLAISLAIGNNINAINLFGILFLVLASFSWSIGSLLFKYKKNSNMTLVMSSSIQMIFSGLILILISLAIKEPYAIKDCRSIFLLIYMIVFGSLICFPLTNFLLTNLPVSKALVYTYINPIISYFFSIIFLREKFNIYLAILMSITVLFVFLLNKESNKINQE